MITLTKKFTKTLVKPQKTESIELQDWKQGDFLQEVVENLEDGILILSKVGELLHANAAAFRLCCQFNQDNASTDFVPTIIWDICKSLLENRGYFLDKLVVMSEEIMFDKSNNFRIRVRLINLDRLEAPCFLVTIENRYESIKNLALCEVKKFELTPREAEIWFLYRSNYSYKEIAIKLYITINTVKKHMKNIHNKRQAFLKLNA